MLPDGIGGEILDRAGRADRRAGQGPPIDSRSISSSPSRSLQRGVHRLGRQPGGADRPGLDLQIEVAVGKAVRAVVADEQRGEGGKPVDVERAAGKLEHRRTAWRRAAAGASASPRNVASPSPSSRSLKRLPLCCQVDPGAETGGGQPPDRVVDILRHPGREAGGLADRQKQRAGKAELAFGAAACRRPRAWCVRAASRRATSPSSRRSPARPTAARRGSSCRRPRPPAD